MSSKYLKKIKKTVIDYIEHRISASTFKEIFNKFDELIVYKDLDKNGYKEVSNFVSAVSELDDQTTLESQWIVKTIDDFYAYFTNNFDYIYSKDFYKFLKLGLNKENKNPAELSFNLAVQDYLNSKINNDCLGYIANEYLNNLKYFQKEINSNKKFHDILETASKLRFNRILEDLTQEEIKTKQNIDNVLKKYLGK